MSFYDYYDDSQESNEYYPARKASKMSTCKDWTGWTGKYSSLTPIPYSTEASNAYFSESVTSLASSETLPYPTRDNSAYYADTESVSSLAEREPLPYPNADNSAYYVDTESMAPMSASWNEAAGRYDYYADTTATSLFTSNDDYYAYVEQGVNTDLSHLEVKSVSHAPYVSQVTQTCELPTHCPENSQSSNKHCTDEPLGSDKRRSDKSGNSNRSRHRSRPSSSPQSSEKPAKSLKTTTQNWVNKQNPNPAKYLKMAQVATQNWVDKQKETTREWVDKQKKDALMVSRLLGKDYRLKLDSQSSQKMAKGFSSVCP
ncbi:uncharacterized protein B0J16DRAFT_387109 [Fusarium flagelliforme]|uniref:uncharacterized protein n=1 Tax=Fusarium flagelliforme TaxID=2675880 RepID=UPI001E8CC80E|nr:uncharacterized protein B0J16DRAFT_387109 [Fusarium flagelliforme]KAH7179275.1 hypothetical protein B0J16DRAFT_387109 [Fusarium flagelliforme]